ncbi:jg22832, partial [Pararge aegeria aegeria]
IIQKGFRKDGICPLNKDAIPKEKFDSLTWSRWEELQQQNKQPRYDTDYNGEILYYSLLNSSEGENIEDFFQNILEESIDEDLQKPLPLSTKGQEEKRPKLKSERLNE